MKDLLSNETSINRQVVITCQPEKKLGIKKERIRKKLRKVTVKQVVHSIILKFKRQIIFWESNFQRDGLIVIKIIEISAVSKTSELKNLWKNKIIM